VTYAALPRFTFTLPVAITVTFVRFCLPLLERARLPREEVARADPLRLLRRELPLRLPVARERDAADREREEEVRRERLPEVERERLAVFARVERLDADADFFAEVRFRGERDELPERERPREEEVDLRSLLLLEREVPRCEREFDLAAVSRLTSLLKLLCCPPAVWSCTSNARPLLSNLSNHSSHSISSSEPSPL
jgi:hypothetical protein